MDANIQHATRLPILLFLSCAGVTLASFYLCFAFDMGLGKWALAFGRVAFAAGHVMGPRPVA